MKNVTEDQKERIILWVIKTCKLQHIMVFCNYSCSVAADTFGLNCNVNRQDMKRDRVSAFCYNKRCMFRVETAVQYLACTVPVPGCRHKTEHTAVQCVVSV